jgi:TonB family protein
MRLRVPLALALCLAGCSKDAAPPQPPGAAQPPAPAAPPRGETPRPAARGDEGPAPELTLASFRKFTKQRSKEVRRCYEAALANDPTLRGKVTLTFTVLPGGGVSEVRVARSTFRTAAVPSCVVSVVRGWKTPFRPEAPVDVEYPIDFGAK